jgi:hypothetical protein
MSYSQNFIREWAALVSAEADGDSAKAFEIASRIQSNSSSYQYRVVSRKALQKKIDTLSEAVNKSIGSAFADVKALISKAKTYKAAQEASEKFNSMYQKMGRTSYHHPMRQEMENSRQVLTYWMNALSAEESNDPQAALQAIQNLESSGYRHSSLLDWAMVTAKKKQLTERLLALEGDFGDPMVKMIDEHIVRVKTTDELLAFGVKLQTMMNSSSGSYGSRQEVQYLVADLQQLGAANTALQARQYGQLFQYPQSTGQYAHRWKTVLGRHYQAICAKAIAAMCQVDELKPEKEGQGIDQVLLAIADKAVEAKDWEKVHRYLDTYRLAFFPNYQSPSWLQSEITASRAFIAGRNFEKAEQFTQAATQYMMVLQCVGKRVPSDEATTRLRDIKAKHPDAIKSLAPPAMPVESGAMYPLRPMHMRAMPSAEMVD